MIGKGLGPFALVVALLLDTGAIQRPDRVLECESTFPRQLSSAALEKTFGRQHLGEGEIQTGEGQVLSFAKTVADHRSGNSAQPRMGRLRTPRSR
jgi:hypothetical protein